MPSKPGCLNSQGEIRRIHTSSDTRIELKRKHRRLTSRNDRIDCGSGKNDVVIAPVVVVAVSLYGNRSG
jgi:hypothetical protein